MIHKGSPPSSYGVYLANGQLLKNSVSLSQLEIGQSKSPELVPILLSWCGSYQPAEGSCVRVAKSEAFLEVVAVEEPQHTEPLPDFGIFQHPFSGSLVIGFLIWILTHKNVSLKLNIHDNRRQ